MSIQPAKPLLSRGPYAVAAADQRQRMLAALPELIAACGYRDLTVAQIVKAAKVRRNAFYEQFEGKHDCFAAAYELAQEHLLGVLTFRCYTRSGLTERVEASLGAGLELLASEPGMARLLAVEPPVAGGEILARHYEWLDRYGRMLRLAAIGIPDTRPFSRGVERAIVGGLAARVGRQVMAGEGERLGELAPSLSAHLLSFYPPQPQSSSTVGGGPVA
jgi:AcrR family transcriptional regulator